MSKSLIEDFFPPLTKVAAAKTFFTNLFGSVLQLFQEELFMERRLTAQEITIKRKAAGIAGVLVCRKAGITRNRLSDIERGYVSADDGEIARLNDAINALTVAQAEIRRVAAEVGWPMAVVAG